MKRWDAYYTQPCSAFVMMTTEPSSEAAQRHRPTCSSREANCTWSCSGRDAKDSVWRSFARSIHDDGQRVSSQSNTRTVTEQEGGGRARQKGRVNGRTGV